LKKIGIMGGTFNPIHNGHLLLAECAKDEYQLDKVLFIPTGHSYLKDDEEVLEAAVRAELTELAIKDNPDFELSTIEIEREGNTYTYETLLELKERIPDCELYFILGADCLFSLDKWRNFRVIFENAVILAAIRDGFETKDFLDRAEYLKKEYNAKIKFVYLPQFDVSSTQIRDKIKDNKSIRYLVPDVVRKYITDKKLFQ